MTLVKPGMIAWYPAVNNRDHMVARNNGTSQNRVNFPTGGSIRRSVFPGPDTMWLLLARVARCLQIYRGRDGPKSAHHFN